MSGEAISFGVAYSPADLFALIEGDLRPWVETEKNGRLSIAKDPFEVQELLGEAPGRFRVILAWDGEKSIGHHQTGVVAHELRVIVSHNRGLAAIKGSNLSAGRAGDVPLMKLATDVRDRLRTINLPNNQTSRQLQYLGCEPVSIESEGRSFQLDAYQLTFRLPAAITRLSSRDFRPPANS
jgi:hypothetical protein